MLNGLDTLPDALRHHAKSRPDDVALTFVQNPGEEAASWTYQDLDRRAAGIAAALMDRGLAGERVLLMHPPGLEFVAALFGCFYAGVTAVPTYPLRSRPDSRANVRLASLADDADPMAILSTAVHLRKTRQREPLIAPLNDLPWLATDEMPSPGNAEPGPPPLDSDSLAMLQYTSGSTRMPRGVMLSHRNLMENQRVIAAHMRHSQRSRMVSWLPPYHDMGLIGGILQPLTVGFPLVLMDAAPVLQHPLKWLQAISRTKATTSGAPNSFFQVCVQRVRPEERDNLDLTSWRVAFNGSEPIRWETLRGFTEYFAGCGFHPDGFYPCYGLAESTLLVTGRTGCRVERLERRALERGVVRANPDGAPSVSCGTPGPGLEIAIVEPGTTRECGENEVGEVWVCGPSVAQGYWRKPEETIEVFENALPGRAGRFLRTGDLGFLRDGELFVVGRIKDLIIVHGRNLYAQDVEALAGSVHPALSPDTCAAFGNDGPFGEELLVACEVKRGDRARVDTSSLVRQVHQAIAEELEVTPRSVLLVKAASLPRTTSGKLRRQACRTSFLEGTLEVIATGAEQDSKEGPPPGGTDAGVRRELALVADALPHCFDPRVPLALQGIDSLARVELVARLEARFRVRLDPAVIEIGMTLEALVAAVDRALRTDGQHASRPSAKVRPGARIPLTPSQLGLFDESPTDLDAEPSVIVVRIPAGVVPARLAAALRCCGAHDAVHLRVRRAAAAWAEAYGKPDTWLRFRRIDARDSDRERVRAMGEQFVRELPVGFDLSEGPVVQAALFDRGTERAGVLFLAVHPLIADRASIRLLLLRVESEYFGEPVAECSVSYGDWASRLESLAQSPAMTSDLSHWRDVCRAAAPPTPAYVGASLETTAPLSLTGPESERFLARYETSSAQHDAFLTALAQAWDEATGGGEICVLVRTHGRFSLGGAEPVGTIGRFATDFPIRVNRETRSSPRRLIEETPHFGLSFGLLRHLCRDPAIRQAISSLFVPQAALIYRSGSDGPTRSGARFPVVASFVPHLARRQRLSRPGLSVYAGVENGRISVSATFAHALYDPPLVHHILSRIRAVVLSA